MKKVILSLAVLAVTSFSIMAANENNNAKNNEKARTECCKQKSGECKGKKDGKSDREDKFMKAFEGLNLTDAQKSKLEELRKECQAKRDAVKKDGEKKDKKENLTQEQKQQLKAEKMAKRQQEKQEMLNNIKSILTPEQYTKFLENNVKFSAKHDKGMKKMGKNMKGQKGMQAQKNKKDRRNGQNDNGMKQKTRNAVSA